MKGEAYFIAPSGDIISVDQMHIDDVLKHPDKFRMTKEEIKEIYQKHNEPIGLEGKAREEILSRLIEQGWTRIRHNQTNDTFTIQINRLDKRRKEHIWSFALQALEGLKGKKYYPNTETKILNLRGDDLGKFTLKDLTKDVLFKESKRVIHISEYQPHKSIIDKVIAKLKH